MAGKAEGALVGASSTKATSMSLGIGGSQVDHAMTRMLQQLLRHIVRSRRATTRGPARDRSVNAARGSMSEKHCLANWSAMHRILRGRSGDQDEGALSDILSSLNES